MDPDEVDIYEDLGGEVEQLKFEIQQLGQHIVDLEQNKEAMQIVIAGLETTKANLKKNISALFLTAQTEIERKDRMIVELRSQVDDMRLRQKGIPRADNKRKRQENPLDMNTAEKFKYGEARVRNDLFDENRRRSTSSNARDTLQMNPRDVQQNRRNRSRSRERGEMYRDERSRGYNDKVRRADDRDSDERYRRLEERRRFSFDYF